MRRSNFRRWFFVAGVIILLFAPRFSQALDTFSICAVDTVTGEVGSAGASCIAGSILLSDVHPGVGVIHTQAQWSPVNQNYARSLMDAGYSPSEIVSLLVQNDALHNPRIRQYGVVDLIDGGRSAAHTGRDCPDYKGQRLGPTYAIQGNTLAGPEVLDSMKARFERTDGSLADRLMAALQGAKIPGADTRCLARGTSSISAFIRVAQPADTNGVLFLDLEVPEASWGVEPIDLLQAQFDEWKAGLDVKNDKPAVVPKEFQQFPNYPNPFNPSTMITVGLPQDADLKVTVYNLLGREVAQLANDRYQAGYHRFVFDGSGLPSGIYFVRATVPGKLEQMRKVVLMK